MSGPDEKLQFWRWFIIVMSFVQTGLILFLSYTLVTQCG